MNGALRISYEILKVLKTLFNKIIFNAFQQAEIIATLNKIKYYLVEN